MIVHDIELNNVNFNASHEHFYILQMQNNVSYVFSIKSLYFSCSLR